MNNSKILQILSPLIFFIFHVIYLIALSKDHFLNKWIDGSFTFFVALVLCNIIRARVVAQADQNDSPHDEDHCQESPESTGTPDQSFEPPGASPGTSAPPQRLSRQETPDSEKE